MSNTAVPTPLGATARNRTPRVAIVTNVLSHYRVPCFQELANRLNGKLDIFTLTEQMDHRRYVLAAGPAGLHVEALPGVRWRRAPQDDFHLNDVRPVLRDKPDVLVLGGWDEPTYLLLWIWAWMARIQVLFWIESTLTSAPRSALKERYKRLLLRRSSGCVAASTEAMRYCRALGATDDRIYLALNAGDPSYFSVRADIWLPRRSEIRNQQGLDGFVVLFVGRLVEGFKGVATLIRACAELEGSGDAPLLLLIGDGPDAGRYRDLANSLELRRLKFLGVLDHETLCLYYAAADVLVLPSIFETWGFVLNEAMEFGLPLVVSDRVGAAADLVHSGKNGEVFPAGDAVALAAVLRDMARQPLAREFMGNQSRRLIKKFSPKGWADGFSQALEQGGTTLPLSNSDG